MEVCWCGAVVAPGRCHSADREHGPPMFFVCPECNGPRHPDIIVIGLNTGGAE